MVAFKALYWTEARIHTAGIAVGQSLPRTTFFFFFSLMIANSTVLKPFVGDLKGVYIFGPSFSRFIGFEV